ncbi:MAG TPA: polysaccharide biosynthesis tyrosine autokinase [Gemmatimonadota bacterium]|nr:polysaccharide biosynthesis tyrosine autokinase [Gemmatimonadota bacterium]
MYLRLLLRNAGLIGAVAIVVLGATAWWAGGDTPRYRAIARLGLPPEASASAPGRAVLGAAVDLAGLRIFSLATGAPAGIVEDPWVSLPASHSMDIRLRFQPRGVAYGSGGILSTAYGEPIVLSGVRFRILVPPPEDATVLRVVPRAAAIDHVESGLEWVPDPAAGTIEVRFTGEDPRVAERTAGAVAEAYRQAVELAAARGTESERLSLARELRAADSSAALAEAELQALRSRERRGRLEAELRALERYLEAVERAGDRGRAADLPAGPAGDDPLLGSLHARLADHMAQRETLLARPSAPGASHPDVLRLSALIASTEERLAIATRARMRSLRTRIESLGSFGPAAAGAAAAGDTLAVSRELAALRGRAAELAERLAEPDPAPAVAIEVSSGAEPVRGRIPPAMPIALLAGIALGVGAALVRERVTRGAPADPSDALSVGAEALAPVPILAVIPEVTPSLVAPGSGGDFRPAPGQSAGIEAYGELRSALQARSWGLKTLAVTSASPGEGKTTTSTNLAAVYARSGLKVVIVECDLRRPSLGRYFEISKQLDLVDVLFEGGDWRLALQLTRTPGLYVLLGEKSFPKAGDSIGGPEMERLLSEITREYDLVILDTSPLLVSQDAIALSPIVDGVLLVVRSARSDPATVDDVIEQLRAAGANVVGIVLNDPDGAADRREEFAAGATS